jgi:hypothetical protein
LFSQRGVVPVHTPILLAVHGSQIPWLTVIIVSHAGRPAILQSPSVLHAGPSGEFAMSPFSQTNAALQVNPLGHSPPGPHASGP